ncbi:hypothetical protein BBAD15_g1987 [Beauveria bassiana D1-5]|uniref:Velvet domain-containing protein n=1 Tax=Beauveria bassiana D1-5 TaxID=1245745 RepID=A0A0A2WGL8_BEABA|nr:hypothetical protein BBAD15_g1987 [Beauveria bassiana D1-5]
MARHKTSDIMLPAAWRIPWDRQLDQHMARVIKAMAKINFASNMHNNLFMFTTREGLLHRNRMLSSSTTQELQSTQPIAVRQQPRAARACGFGDRDRRVNDPPPIVQLRIDGPGLSEEERRAYLRYPNYVMNCSIWDESGTRDASYMPDEYNHQRRLMGSLVGTPFVGDDDRNQEGCFFCFSDLSCRTPGAFRLKFTLIMIDPARASILRHFPTLTEIKTDIFQVYSAKEFPGMVASSSLAKKLKEQGCIISIKKGNERARPRGADGRSDDEDD